MHASLFGTMGFCAAAATAQSQAVTLNPTTPQQNSLQTPRLVQSGDTIHACGSTAPTNFEGYIHYARSLDGGLTWPLREVPLAYAYSVSDLAASGNLVAVLIGSRYLGPHVVSSFDGGGTFGLPVRVSSQNAHIERPSGRMHIDGTHVNVVWLERRQSGGAIWTNRSTDGGVTWLPVETRLDMGVAPTNDEASKLELVADGALLHALWQQNTPSGPQVLRQTSRDGGVTWLPQPDVVVTSSMMSAGGQGNLLFVSRGSPLFDLRSTNGGATWLPVTVGFLGFSDVAVSGQEVLAVHVSGLGTYQLKMDASHDGGATWLPVPFVLPSPLPLAATASIVGKTMLVHGQFQVFPETGFVIQSDDKGVTWRLMTNNAGLGLWPSRNRLLATTFSGNGRVVAAFVLAGHTTLGTGTPGTGGIVPQLEGNGLPTLGRTFALEVRDALANALALLAVSFAPRLPTQISGTTVWVQSPISTIFFVASNSGAASLPVTLPTSTAFSGLVLTSQAFVLDPLAGAGFSATGARQTWIR